MTNEKIKKIVADHLDIDVEDIQNDSTFEDLGIDSLDAVEIMMELEDEFGMELDASEMGQTVNDLAAYIDSRAD
ncbi:MAG: acyl carrier protein [Clostridiales bacterium]|nr:acyl carrier protein [Clostridiales bacterium]